jgi:hypothetical protein
MPETYKIFRKLGNGQEMHVGSRDKLEQAEQLIESLNRHWAGDYSIQEPVSTTDGEKRQPHN